MSENHRPSNHLPSPGAMTSPSFSVGKLPLVPALIVSAGVLGAFFVWTLPNWTFFLQNVPRFPALWQLAVNRPIIIILILKVCSPVLVGLLVAACSWLSSQAKLSLQEEVQAHTRPGQGPRRPLQEPFPSPETTRANGTSSAQRPPHEQRANQVHNVPQRSAETSLPSTQPMQRQQQPQGQALWSTDPSSRRGVRSAHAAALLQRRSQRLNQLRVQPGTDGALDSPAQEASVAVEATPEQEQDLLAAPSPIPTHLGEQRPYEVAITLLKKVSVTLLTAQGIRREVPLTLNAKRVQLLAYLAWQRGQTVNRDRMVEQVFGHGREDEEATREKLGEAFDSHKKLLRWDLREAIAKLNAEAGTEVIPPDLDVFTRRQHLYWLSESCRVTDLEELETHHQIIEAARKEGLLVDQVPEEVKEACDQLIAAYSGDFIGELITDYLDDFEPWAGSWARKPYTLFRDYYLQALWYAAEYELRKGQQITDELAEMDAHQAKRKRQHWGQAAQLYRTYAMTACNSRFDTKVTFSSGGQHGERVIMSERALRRSLVLYGSIGSTHLVDQVYSAYYRQMRSISAKAWEPSKTTLADLQGAKSSTNAYRFPTKVTPHEPSSRPLETSA